MSKPFILRSEMKELSASERARREAFLGELTPEEIERVSGATNCNTFSPSDWSNDNGMDLGCSKD
jgi:hypothetical protein